MSIRFWRHKFAVLVLIIAGVLRILVGSAYSDTRQEVDGSNSSDSDLDSPFSITTTTYGFPGAVLSGIQSFSFTIPNVTNPTPVNITTQVYLSNGFNADSMGALVLTGSPVPVTGCTLTVPAMYSGSWPPSGPPQSCTVNTTDSAKMVSQGIMNPLASTQRISFGLGAEAKYLVFSGTDSQGDASNVTMNITPGPTPPLNFVATAGGPANLSQNYSLPPFSGSISAPSLSTPSGENWLTSASLSSTASPSQLTVNVAPAGLAA